MDIRVTGHRLSVSDGMRDHLQDRLVRFEKYTSRLVEAHAILKKEKYFYKSEITLSAKNFKAYGDGESKDNIFAAIDMAAMRVEKQLKKYREKLKDHRVKSEKPLLELVVEEKAASRSRKSGRKSSAPDIIHSGEVNAKPMSAREASMNLQESADPFLVFFNMKSDKMNLIFKRDDGHHGLVEF